MKKKKRRRAPAPLWRRWLYCLLPAVIAAVMYLLLPHVRGFTERFITRGLFRAVAFPVEWLMSLLPFSVTELVVVLCVPAVLTLLICFIVRLVRSREPAKTAERGARFAAWCLSLLLLIFMVMDGANFSRLPVGTLMDLPERTYTPEELALVVTDLAQKTTAAREATAQDEDGCMILSKTLRDTLLSGDDCYRPLRERYPFLIGGTWRVKPVMLSHQWSYTGYTGVYCPWLGEASVNVDVPPCELGHTVTHELAHTMGFAREDECNFLGYLACVESGDPDYVYSGYLSAYLYCSNALYAYDKEMWRECYQHLGEGVRRDLKQRNAYWKQFEGQVQESSQKVNDAFIKANGDDKGTLSYGQMVAFVLRWYDAQGAFSG